jgi:hypothetical protein
MSFGPYALAGWRVESDLDLPELLPWNPAFQTSGNLFVEARGPLDHSGPRGFRPTDDGGGSLNIPDVAVFRLNPTADRVAVHLCVGAEPVMVRAFLYGSVLALLCYKRGLLPLHGSAVSLNGRAAIFSGPSGSGKSTLATAMAMRGHFLLSDDVCALDLTDPAKPLLWPAFPRVKLREDAMEWFRLDGASLYTQAAQGRKGHFGMGQRDGEPGVTGPIPVGGIYAISAESAPECRCERLPLAAAFEFLLRQVHRAKMGTRLGLGETIFRQTCALSAAAPVFRLMRPGPLDRIQEIAGLVEASAQPPESVWA